APTDAAPAAPTDAAPAAPTDATTAGPQAGPGEASSASRPVTDTFARVLDPVTGTVRTLADARPVTTVVHTLDGVVGGVPVVRSVLGGDTLGTVTGPVAGLVDDTLGDVGAVVGSVPQVVTDLPPTVDGVLPGGADPVVDVPTGPVGGGSTTPVASVPPPTASAPHTAGAGARAVVPDPAAHRPAAGGPVSADPTAAASTSTVRDATYGGRALLVPVGHGVTFDGPAGPSGAGALGGSAAGSAGSAAAVGIVGSDDQVSLAAGSRGTLSNDAVPASVVGEHDVAPD
uniref:hypothetical protein n=1 Tax=unclassified Curtobacterium TaxID=257496 RepID=UPI003A7FCAC3